jgi:ATP-binding cassette, subfamily B, bacterial
MHAYWNLLSRYVRPQRLRFAALAGLLLGSMLLQVVDPQVMRYFIDTALGQGALRLLMAAAGLFIAIAILQQVVAVGVAYLGESVAWTATNALRAELARHCLNLDLSFHNEHTPGELIERIDGDVTTLAGFFSQVVVTVLGNVLLVIGVLVALFRENSLVGIVFSAFAAASIFAMLRARSIAVAPEKARRQASAELFGFVEEQLAGTEDLRSSGAVDFSLGEVVRLHAVCLRHESRASVKEWLLHNLIGAILLAGNMLAMGLGYLLYTRGTITIGTAYLFVHYLDLLEAPLWTLTHQVQGLQAISACVERLAELLGLRSRVIDPPAGSATPTPRGAGRPPALEFERVSFAYEDGKPVLRDVSFTLAPGQVLGLLGRTGSGKTTLSRLVFRLYDPSAGEIRLDGTDLRAWRVSELRGGVGMVTQDVQLFGASVRDNLTFFDKSIPDASIRAVLAELELDEWYRALPNGLDTVLSAGGRSLSAGEAQLLAFARIFLRDPGLVILDEASSRLDPATEARIGRATERLLRGRSALIVAHRLGTVQRADQIMILADGQICEHGPRARLAGDPHSLFHGLLQSGLEEVLA